MKNKIKIITSVIAFGIVAFLACVPFVGNIFGDFGGVFATTSLSTMFASSADGSASYDSDTHTVNIEVINVVNTNTNIKTDDKVFYGDQFADTIDLKIVVTNSSERDIAVGVSDTTIYELENLTNIKGSVIYTDTEEDFRNATIIPGETLEFTVRYVLIDCNYDANADIQLVISVSSL